jgi:TonB family protein
MLTRLILAVVLSGLAVPGFAQDKPVIVVKHLEPMRYPDLARQARLQGSISIQMKISSSGTVVDAEANTTDTLLKEHPLLQKETVKVIRKWTFGCDNCAPNADYEHVLTFVYKLEGAGTQHNDSRFTLDSAEHATVTTGPPQTNW